MNNGCDSKRKKVIMSNQRKTKSILWSLNNVAATCTMRKHPNYELCGGARKLDVDRGGEEAIEAYEKKDKRVGVTALMRCIKCSSLSNDFYDEHGKLEGTTQPSGESHE